MKRNGTHLLPPHFQLLKCPVPRRPTPHAYLLFYAYELRFHLHQYPDHWSRHLGLGHALKNRPLVAVCSYHLLPDADRGCLDARHYDDVWHCHPFKYYTLLEKCWEPCSPLEALITLGTPIDSIVTKLQDYISIIKAEDASHEQFMGTFLNMSDATLPPQH